MPGEWIKMRLELHDSPKVRKVARITGLDRFGVIGRLHRIWGWVDQTSEDGQALEGELADIDEMTDCPGFGAAMVQVGWLQEVAGCLHFANFTEHNGKTAKRRAEDAKRKYDSRQPCPQNVRTVADKMRTDCGHIADQEPEPEPEDKTPPPPPRGAAASRRGGGGKKPATAEGRAELTAEGHRLGGAAAAFVDSFPTICTAAQWSAAGLAKLNGQAERLKITDGELTAAMDRLQSADRKYPTPKPSEVSEVLRDIFRRRGA